MSSRLVLPVALGLSVVTVTAFVVYYIFKKDDENDNDNEEKKVKTSRENVVEVKILKSIMPALIGRGRSNINSIEASSGAKIHCKDFSDGQHEVMYIRGTRAATQLAEALVLEFIKQQPKIVDETFKVPAWACGKIIGTGGANIKDIMHRSGARIKVEGLSTDTTAERNVTVCGSVDQIKTAKDLIDNLIAQERCRREMEQSKLPRHVPRSTSASPTGPPTGTQNGSPSGSQNGPLSGTQDGPNTDAEDPGDARLSHAKYKRPEKAASSIEVYVSAVSSPSRFWVQFVGPQVLIELEELVTHMTEYYGKKENRDAHALSHVSVGQVVAAVFRHDSRWYRARVTDIRPNEFDHTQMVADVFFLDYGDNEYVATHELCELRADLLRLRFQAMECFLAGVRPAGGAETVGVTAKGQRWDKWQPQAVERFEELTHVAEWKPLISRTCTYKKTIAADGEKEKEIPGIKLYQMTDEGELDIGGVLIAEGWAVEGAHSEPAHPAAHGTPFGDLGNSRVLGMLEGDNRSSSVPKDHKDSGTDRDDNHNDTNAKDKDALSTSKSLSSGLDNTDQLLSISNFDLSLETTKNSHDFINNERQNSEQAEKLAVSEIPKDEFKANMNRIDSHHGNLEALGRSDLRH